MATRHMAAGDARNIRYNGNLITYTSGDRINIIPTTYTTHTTAEVTSKWVYNPTTTTQPTLIYDPYIIDNTYNDSWSTSGVDFYKDINFDDIIQLTDPDKDGVFKVGSLYRVCYDIPYIYFDKDWEHLVKSKAALCLGSELYPMGIPICKHKEVNGCVETKDLNRVWITKFLVGDKVIAFSWYENATLLSAVSNTLPFGSSSWLRLIADPTYKSNGRKNKKKKNNKTSVK